ncbi:5'-nucleotidase C-terminal domain-containing protein [Shinella sedimenti]|uniref:5'-nucleotidase C-terminal domain-containing protein n=1 Tax=Shinella sedimenti TaxID=2919913 RepID=A0ABT0CPJ1_9HYPH|nr:5'-nucleotidase C-terminal domain-containing protein [Shinella sedimenti]MCJ8150530.1 5'-nucleotidase C-terminal domain-containing protein [Shinella sedimenti]
MTIFRSGLLAASLIALSSGSAFADYELNILHINDLHSRIEAINKYDSTCSAEEEGKNECFGGIARVKTAIDNARKALTDAKANVLVLDAGDQFQGSLFYTTYKSQAVAEFMNGIGFDAMAVGNHEFDDGPEELAKFLDQVKFPVISGNTVAGAETPIANRIKGYVVKEIGGEKVAVVSVLATDTGETSSPGKGVVFEDEITYLKSVIPTIEAEGVNKIILLSHVGYKRDKEIAAAVEGIDVIVGGHSHTLLSSTDDKAAGPYPTLVKNPAGVEVPIAQAYAYSKYLGELKVVFDDAGKVTATSGAPLLLDAAVTPHTGFAARVKELGAPIEELKKKEVAETTDTIDGSRETCRAQECTMGNLVADAILDRVKAQGISIAIQNGGGLRASIDKGVVTMGEVLTVLPFQNSLATFQLKGSDVVLALENGLSEIEDGAGRFPQVSGLKYTFDRSKPAGSRVVSVEVKEGETFAPLDPAKTYGVVSNNYMRAGGDGYSVFATSGQNAYDFGPNLELVVADYLAAHRPYKPYTDGRIAEVTAATTQPVANEAKTATDEAATSTPAGTVAAGGKHVIARGDTLWDIAKAAYGDGTLWRRIAEANGNPRPRALHIGTELSIPGK